ncbi:MAG: CDP-glycerol glycerophosphotransferase family protein [Deltaproteobacteria bacterium]|nr:CDP-glycerol glycerophosphotransferase family protein [Deltaproteobacteria bacterium]
MNIVSLDLMKKSLRRTNPWIYQIRMIFGWFFARPRFLALLHSLQLWMTRSRYYTQLFQQYSPDAIMLTHSIALQEIFLACFAKKQNVPIIVGIHSWDTLTTKTGMAGVGSKKPRCGRTFPVRFNKILVWNEILKDQLIRFYGYSPNDISISGIPQFDSYIRNGTRSRESFFARYHLDPSKKLILYAAGNPVVLPHQDEIISILLEAFDQRDIQMPSYLMIRNHPGHDTSSIQKMAQDRPDVLFDQPSIAYAALSNSSGWQNGNGDTEHFAELLFAADLVINVWSTVSLDAAIFGKPTICIAFDGQDQKPYLESVRRFYDYTHYQPLVKSGGIRLVENKTELISAINQFLKNPRLNENERKKMILEQATFLDGQSGRRMAEQVQSFLDESRSSSS